MATRIVFRIDGPRWSCCAKEVLAEPTRKSRSLLAQVLRKPSRVRAPATPMQSKPTPGRAGKSQRPEIYGFAAFPPSRKLQLLAVALVALLDDAVAQPFRLDSRPCSSKLLVQRCGPRARQTAGRGRAGCAGRPLCAGRYAGRECASGVGRRPPALMTPPALVALPGACAAPALAPPPMLGRPLARQ